MKISTKKIDHCQAELQIFCAQWGNDFWSYEEIQKSALASDLSFYFCTKSEITISICITQDHQDFSDLLYIFTVEKHRGQGAGEILLRHVLTRSEKLYLEVKSSNEKAITLYEKVGFQHSLTRPRYYKTGEDAKVYIFVKN